MPERAKPEPSGIITLISDFGTRDSYVGTMKGVILGICPRANLVDITHDIAPQDLMEASLVLGNCYAYFPSGTVHLVVVDPGVGTPRKPIVAVTGSHFFVGPDNGVLSAVYAAEATRVFEMSNQKYMLSQVSDTFHGRDIFAPAAAHLANGLAPEAFGPQVLAPVRREPPQPEIWDDHIKGEIIHIDSFGDVITNISRSLFNSVVGDREFRIVVNGRAIAGISRTYQEAERNRLLALFGSSDMLEVCVNGGRAERRLGVGKGDIVLVQFKPAGRSQTHGKFPEPESVL